MFGITRILSKQFAGNVRAFAAMNEPFCLAATGYRTFAVKRVSVCFYAAAAAAGFLICTSGAMKSASGIDHMYYLRFLKTMISASEPFSPYSQTNR